MWREWDSPISSSRHATTSAPGPLAFLPLQVDLFFWDTTPSSLYNFYICSGGFKGGIRTQVGRKAGAGGRRRVLLQRCLRPPAGQPPGVHPTGQQLYQPGQMDGIPRPCRAGPTTLCGSRTSWLPARPPGSSLWPTTRPAAAVRAPHASLPARLPAGPPHRAAPPALRTCQPCQPPQHATLAS